jgi:hypothetical protein
MTTAVAAATPMTTTTGGSGPQRRTSVGSGAEDLRPSSSTAGAAAVVVTAKKRSASSADDAAAVMMTMTPHLLPNGNGNSNKKPAPERLVLGQLDDASSNRTADDDAHKAEPTVTTMSTTTTTSNDNTSRAALEAVRAEHEALRKLAKECFQAHQTSCHDLEQLTQRLREALNEADRFRSMDEHNRKTIAVRVQWLQQQEGLANVYKAKGFLTSFSFSSSTSAAFLSQNLIRAKEVAMAQARAALEVTSNDGALRAELSALTAKYEAATTNHQESSRKCALLKGELDHAHMQLSKSRSDTAKVDRELRKATHALHHAQSQSGSGSGGNDFAASAAESDKSELDFYKGKSSSLSVQLNRLKAVEAEKDRQIDELRRQVERYQMIGHHKLHDGNAAASASGKGGSHSTNGGGMHKSKTH